ncbi:MAG: oxidoreductase [Mucilaginibacter polytrichastri]|nr:oxidoreductase [Mucilaginibacter polytrichastri]
MKRLSLLLILIALNPIARAQNIEELAASPCKSIRGLSVVNDRIAWASGTQGYVGITKDGGDHWAWAQVPGMDTLDFRDIEAFSDQKAVIMSSGTPAVILTTENGGKSWEKRYFSNKPEIFLDEMDFADEKTGTILGDPVNGKFLLMNTLDGGKTWTEANAPEAQEGEACFAASGTGIRYTGKNRIAFATGGSVARVFIGDGKKWIVKTVPVVQGKGSQGIFSFATQQDEWLFVGGDYIQPNAREKAGVRISGLLKNAPEIAASPVNGYRSCVEFLGVKKALATGPGGTELSTDGGKSWKKLGENGYHVCRKAKKSKLVLLAGSGKLARYTE